MKSSDEFRTKKNEYDDDAQAVSRSELLPIYEAMSFSGDIQPLDDISEPEEIKTDFENKKNENRGYEKKSLKKKKISAEAGSKIKTFVAAVIMVVIVAGAICGGYLGIKKADINTSPVVSIYKTADGNNMIRLADGTEYSMGDATGVSVSSDGMFVWYCRNTSSTTGKYDIRMIDISSKKSLKKEGIFVDKGIDEGWKTTKDGKFACYGITKSGITSCYMYSAETEKTVTVADTVDEYFPSSVGNVTYFTRKSGNTYSLHRTKFGEKSENVASGVRHVKYVGNDDDYEIFYTMPTGEGTNVNLFRVKGEEKASEVCSNVSEVYLNDYTYGGNLYYFTKNKSNVNWQDFISDNYYDSDLKIQKPLESDYMIEKGFIFKRKILDTTKYNAALSRYQQKLARDKIREELNKLDLGLAINDEYTCFVYKSGVSRRMVTGVTLDGIIQYAKSGDPRMIYNKAVIGVNKGITMDTLVSVAAKSNVETAMDYVRNSVQSTYDLNNSCFCSWFDGESVQEYEIKDYDTEKTEFVFSKPGFVFGISNGELYYSNIENSELSVKKLVDSSVSDYVAVAGDFYYEKLESTGTKSLYKFSPENGKTEICRNVYSYFTANDSFVIILTRQDKSEELMSVGIYDGLSYAMLDKDLSLNNFIYNDDSFAYIKNYKSGSGEFYVYTQNGGIVKCGDNVSSILYLG